MYMSKQEKLPNHKINESYLANYIDQDFSNNLKYKYKFNEAFNLYGYLLDTLFCYDSLKGTQSKKSIKAQRALFKKLGKRCKSTSKCLENIGYKERYAIFEQLSDQIDINEMHNELAALANCASIIAKILKNTTPKDITVNARHNRLLSRLADIYQLGTGNNLLIPWYDPRQDTYSGNFLDFVCEFLEEIDEEHSNAYISQCIKRLFMT